MSETTANARLETFCDGIFAIALTILIIDIKIPSSFSITNTSEFWNALKHIAPAIFAFILSFTIIFITWVNHHNNMRLVNKSCSSFIYANGFLMITVVFIPFPTSLMGEYLFTDHSAPAVMLYVATMSFQSLGWIFLCNSAIKNNLVKNEKSIATIRQNGIYGYYAFALYSLCAIAAYWFPITIAIVTTLIWIFWLIIGVNIKHD